jgi:hypothetical protein
MFIEGTAYNIKPDNPRFDELKVAFLEERYDDVVNALTPKKAVNSFVGKSGGVLAFDGTNVVNTKTGETLTGYLVNALVGMAKLGLDPQPLLNFYQKLLLNPSKTSVEQFYPWLEKAQMPIDPDGDVYGYKKVNSNFTSIHDGRTLNSVGSIVEMERNKVDDNRSRTCSSGLHVCSKNYLPSFGSTSVGGARVVLVKFSPSDVVSVPSDYNDAKLRVSRYYVVSDVTDEIKLDGTGTTFNSPVYDHDDEEENDDDYEY